MNLRRRKNKNITFPGLFVSEEEIDALFERKSFSESPSEKRALTAEFAGQITLRKAVSQQTGLVFRLDILKETFHLSEFEVDALLLALASELDSKYEKLFAYLQDDITKKHASTGLILRLFCQSKIAEVAARGYFNPNSPLLNNFILLQGGDIPLLEKTVKLDERIVGFLLGSDEQDYLVASFSSLKQPKQGFEELTIPETLKHQLAALTATLLDSKPLFLLQGSCELLEVAEAICKEAGSSVLVADLEKIKSEILPVALRLLFREAKLQGAAAYLDRFDFVNDEAKKIVVEELDASEVFVFVPSKTELHLKRKTVKVIVPKPQYIERLRVWRSMAGDVEGLDGVASRFKFGKAKVAAAVETAKNAALLRNPSAPSLTLEDIYAGCRSQLNPIALATKITSKYYWSDIMLPPDKKEQLREICNYIKHYATVYESWGFDKHSRGRGLNALFSGPSGSGKTMAAEIIAGELGLDMYKIDLSVVVSKYIGETEKNLNRIFKEAEDSNAVLFFDEADALFGKRSEVKDAHDRYANIEIGYLLQKMEEHEGIVILATNLGKNLDDAFVRRMNFIVEFPFPTETNRLAIWKQIFPKQTPLDPQIDFEFLSKLQLSGGNIKNIALVSAFFAAEHSGIVKMEHVVRATKREFQKIGKAVSKQEFGKYWID